MKKFIAFVTAVLLLMLNSVDGQFICPSPTVLDQCTCDDSGDTFTISITCNGLNIDDAKMSTILTAILSDSTASPTSALFLKDNILTKVPEEIPLFSQLIYVDLFNNQIESIASGAFRFANPTIGLVQIYLSSNPLTGNIESGAFQGDYSNAVIVLESTELTRFESGVFQSVLKDMATVDTSYINLQSSNQIDCASDPCHLKWLISDNRKLLDRVQNGQCSDGTLFGELDSNVFTDCLITCPSPADVIAPCTCKNSGDNVTIKIDCRTKALDDSTMSDILSAILSDTKASPVRVLDLAENALTIVPLEIPLFKQLANVDLSANRIDKIPRGAFNFDEATERIQINLNNNPLTVIQPGAFQGDYVTGDTGLSVISLVNTNLNRFESGVFQSVLEQMAPFNYSESNGAYIILSSSNNIDCTSDKCHLAWLFRDNSHFLSTSVVDGYCSDGSLFTEHVSDDLSDCVVNCPSPTVLEPCICSAYYNLQDPSATYRCEIGCRGLSLDDATMGTILTEILYDTTTSPIGHLDLFNNALTIVPREIRLFKQLLVVNLSSNQIDTVPTGSFDFAPSPIIQIQIDLNNNPLGNVEDGAFKGDYSNAAIKLENTGLTQFDSGVFRSVLEQMEGSTLDSYITLLDSNAIDCENCVLSWLVKENPSLLSNIRNGQCSDGIPFELLNPDDCSTTEDDTTTPTNTTTILTTSEDPSTVDTTTIPTTTEDSTTVATTTILTTSEDPSTVDTTTIPTTTGDPTTVDTTKTPSTTIIPNTCPSGIEPCTCKYSEDGVTISISCDGVSLDDSQISNILKAILLSDTEENPITSLNFTNNKLTKVPVEIRQFRALATVDLSGNQITTVASGSFNLNPNVFKQSRAAGSGFISLNSNPLNSSIESGAFQGDYSNTVILLENTGLTRFDSDVFESVVNDMQRSPDAYINLKNSDKIDCTNQLCDLEWLIKSKPGLLGTTVQNGACSDGTKFEDVDLCLFSSCKTGTCDSFADITNDFESGTNICWHDESRKESVSWNVYNSLSWSGDSTNNASAPAPRPPGSNYLQLVRATKGAFAVGEYRSERFTVSPGDKVSFDFWIQSKFPNFNNLELYMAVGPVVNKKEIKLVPYSTNLNEFSNPTNRDWIKAMATIPTHSQLPGLIELVFYGYLGTDANLDGMAIDNIQLTPILTCAK